MTVKDVDGDGLRDDLTVTVAGPSGSILTVEILNVTTLHTGDWIFT